VRRRRRTPDARQARRARPMGPRTDGFRYDSSMRAKTLVDPEPHYMEICHPHNLNCDLTRARPFGIRVSLPAGDTFARLLGPDWERFHWYVTANERDRALENMVSEHLYSRRGDRPSVVFEAVETTKESDSD